MGRVFSMGARADADPPAHSGRGPGGHAPTSAATAARFTAKAEQLRLERAFAHSHQGGPWERFKHWLGL